MRVAAIYDIHGNLPALEAVLDDISREQVDRIVVGGDVIPGPMLHETLRRLHEIDLPVDFIYGNGEIAVLRERAGQEYHRLPEYAHAIVRWTAEQLRDDDVQRMSAWPKTVRLGVDGIGDVLFCHGTPRDENEIFTAMTREDALAPLVEGLGADLVVCGHTHMQFDRRVASVRVVNAGSVGMPFGVTGADWLLLGPGVELRHTSYDLDAAAAAIRRTAYPQAEDVAANYVLTTPSAEAMLEMFAKAGLQ